MKKNLVLFAGSMSLAFLATRALLGSRKRRPSSPLAPDWFHPGECVGGAE